MAYLLAKFTLFFILAALLGAVFGYWWCRRQFVDVSASHESLLKGFGDLDQRWNALSQRLDDVDNTLSPRITSALANLPQAPAPDLSPLENRLGLVDQGIRKAIDSVEVSPRVELTPVTDRLKKIETALASIKIPEPADLAPVERRLGNIEQGIEAIEIPQPVNLAPVIDRLGSVEQRIDAIPMPKPTDLAPVTSRLGSIEQRIDAIEMPEPTDLAPVTSRLGSIEQRIDAIEMPEPIDLAPVTSSLSSIKQRIDAIEMPESTDLAPVTSRLGTIEQRVEAIRIPAPADLTPVSNKVDRLAEKLDALPGQFICKATKPAPSTGPKLFQRADHGPKDDLKKISGVGPKLERLLNANGVYYFWQVASWSAADVEFIDDRLEVFKGRIERDNWVIQAGELKQSADAAKAP